MRWRDDCDDCPAGDLEEQIESLEDRIAELEEEVEVLKATGGNGYEYPPSTAARITSMEMLKKWVKEQKK